jgi:hypothetical protein
MSIRNPIIIRRSTVRPNIRYMVQRCPNKDQLKVACEMARLRGLKKGERGIFFIVVAGIRQKNCRSCSDVDFTIPIL